MFYILMFTNTVFLATNFFSLGFFFFFFFFFFNVEYKAACFKQAMMKHFEVSNLRSVAITCIVGTQRNMVVVLFVRLMKIIFLATI